MAHKVLQASELVTGMVIVGMAGKVGYEYPNPQPRSDGTRFTVLGNFPCSIRESDNCGVYWRSGITFVPWESGSGHRNATYMDVDDLYLVEVA